MSAPGSLFGNPAPAAADPGDDIRRVEAALAGALEEHWGARHSAAGWNETLDNAVLDALLPFGAHPGTQAIKRHRAAMPSHLLKPEVAAMVEIARQVKRETEPAAGGKPPRREERVYGWTPPADRPEDIARSERIREWAAGLTVEQAVAMRERAIELDICARRWADGRDLRETSMGRAVLVEVATVAKPELLPIGLREDIDTIEKNKARRTA